MNQHHGGEAARPTTVAHMASAVHGGEAHMTSGTFHGQLRAAAARGASFEPTAAAYHSSAEFARHVRAASGGTVPVAVVFHREPGPAVVYANIGVFCQQTRSLDAVLVGPQLPSAVVQVHDSSFYSALQPRPGAGRGVVLADLLPGGGGGAVYNGDYALQPRPAAGHGEVFVDLLPGGGVAVHDDYGYYPWQPRSGAGRREVFIGPLPDGVGTVFDNSGNFAQQTLPGTGRAEGIVGVLRNLGAGYDGSVALADDMGAVYDNRSMLVEHLLRLLPFVGISASSMAVNGLAARPGSPEVAFHLFVLLLGGLFLVILHVLRV